MSKPIIRPLPTENKIRHWVDNIITPERADTEAPLLAKLLLTVSDADNDDLHHLAVTGAKHAFTKTSGFQEAFENFADLPNTTRPQRVIETKREGNPEVIEFENEQ